MTGTPCEAVWLPLQCLTTTLGSTHCQAIRRKKKKKRHPKCAACLGICDDDALNSAEFSKEARGEFASKRHHWGSRQKRRPEEVHLALRRNQKLPLQRSLNTKWNKPVPERALEQAALPLRSTNTDRIANRLPHSIRLDPFWTQTTAKDWPWTN